MTVHDCNHDYSFVTWDIVLKGLKYLFISLEQNLKTVKFNITFLTKVIPFYNNGV